MSLTIPLIIAGAVLALVIAALAFVALRNPGGLQRRIESFFRRPERPSRTAGEEQYYRPYWTR